MSTKNQCFFKVMKKKKALKRAPKLYFKKDPRKRSPHGRGVVVQLRIVTPRKPNSARRPAAKVFLKSNSQFVLAHIPGIGHNLRKFSEVLVRGGGARDLPNVRYTCVRGVLGLDGVLNKRRRRSIYGTKWPSSVAKKLRRKFRKLLF